MKSFVFLAPGFEEIEAVASIDIMRRAGMEVTTVAVTADGSEAVEGAHGVPYVADVHIAELEGDADWFVLPGGMPGATNLYENERLVTLLKEREGGIAAICAAPAVVLGQLGLLEGKPATCYPGFEELCKGAEMTGAPVVSVPGLITAKGPAFAMDFGLAIVTACLGEEKSEEVARGMLF
ncbi:MAG: DJ-1/PfpI family protein [Muribaculaceae bacterium]|nr:DJ-1/PfpI family protein [Muribaculaceae bacterium]